MTCFVAQYRFPCSLSHGAGLSCNSSIIMFGRAVIFDVSKNWWGLPTSNGCRDLWWPAEAKVCLSGWTVEGRKWSLAVKIYCPCILTTKTTFLLRIAVQSRSKLGLDPDWTGPWVQVRVHSMPGLDLRLSDIWESDWGLSLSAVDFLFKIHWRKVFMIQI